MLTSNLGSAHRSGADVAKAEHSQIVPSAARSRMPFTSSGSTPGLAMASLTLNPGPSAWPKLPSMSVASAGPPVVSAPDVGLGALVDIALDVRLGVGLAPAAGVALRVGFVVTPDASAPQAEFKAANEMSETINHCR